MSVWLGLCAALEPGDQLLLAYRVIGSDRCRPNVRIRQIFDPRLDLSERRASPPCTPNQSEQGTTVMGDVGLEPTTSALSRRDGVGRRGKQTARFGTKWLQAGGMVVPSVDR
jgi:hypothetical protein